MTTKLTKEPTDGERLNNALESSQFVMTPWRQRNPVERAQLDRAAAEFAAPYLARIAEAEECREWSMTMMQNALNMAKRDIDFVMRREAELHSILRAFALPSESKALAREMAGRNTDREQREREIELKTARIVELETKNRGAMSTQFPDTIEVGLISARRGNDLLSCEDCECVALHVNHDDGKARLTIDECTRLGTFLLAAANRARKAQETTAARRVGDFGVEVTNAPAIKCQPCNGFGEIFTGDTGVVCPVCLGRGTP